MGSGQPIILGAQPSDLELKRAYLGTQLGDLVKQTPVGRATYVAEEGLRHIFSLICAAGTAGHREPSRPLSYLRRGTGSGAIGDSSIVCRPARFVKRDIES